MSAWWWHSGKSTYRRAGFGGWKEDDITLRWVELKTPGLLRGVGPFRCEAQLRRDRGWKEAKKKEPREKGILWIK